MIYPEIAIIFVGATERQNEFWWPSFNVLDPGVDFDLIYVNRDFDGFAPEIHMRHVIHLINENKVFRPNIPSSLKKHSLRRSIWAYYKKNELHNKAFGAYEYYFQKYKKRYKYFAFISDDVYLRRTHWLKEVYDLFTQYKELGFVSPMLHNNPRHIRAPIWFGRTACLEKISWGFDSDHSGEMEIADRCVEAGYFGMQIGHKVDFAYDPEWSYRGTAPRLCGTPMPMQYFEVAEFGEDHLNHYFTLKEIAQFSKYEDLLFSGDFSAELSSPCLAETNEHQRWNICLEIQPYHGLIYNPSLNIVRNAGYQLKIFNGPIDAGPLNIDQHVFFGCNHRRYKCLGINSNNPIAILASHL